MREIIDFLSAGGPFMYPLGALSIATIVLVFERMFTEKGWREQVFVFLAYIKTGEIPDETSIPDTLKVDKRFYTFSTKKKEAVISEKIQAIFDRRIRVNEIITSIGNIAPLLGFIGTISGMISSFSAIADADKVSIKLVASGISEALITTGYGLVIGVICIIAESLLRYWFVKFSHKIEEEVNIMLRNDECKEHPDTV